MTKLGFKPLNIKKKEGAILSQCLILLVIQKNGGQNQAKNTDFNILPTLDTSPKIVAARIVLTFYFGFVSK